MNPTKEQIMQKLHERGLSLRKASVAMGFGEKYLHGVLYNNSHIPDSRMSVICDFLGFDFTPEDEYIQLPEDTLHQLVECRKALGYSQVKLSRILGFYNLKIEYVESGRSVTRKEYRIIAQFIKDAKAGNIQAYKKEKVVKINPYSGVRALTRKRIEKMLLGCKCKVDYKRNMFTVTITLNGMESKQSYLVSVLASPFKDRHIEGCMTCISNALKDFEKQGGKQVG